MKARKRNGPVKPGFEPEYIHLSFDSILHTKIFPAGFKKLKTFRRVLESIKEVGVIEPLVVHPTGKRRYILLDGHIRMMALQEMGEDGTLCVVSVDDEGFTYNHFVNRVSPIEEHNMITRAIEKGVPEDRIARALQVDVKQIRKKKNLLVGVSPEFLERVKGMNVPAATLRIIKRVTPARQMEMAELMIISNDFSSTYANSMYLTSLSHQKRHNGKGNGESSFTGKDLDRIKEEMARQEAELLRAAETYSSNTLGLVVSRGYVRKLIENVRIQRFLRKNYSDILGEFHRIVDSDRIEGADVGSILNGIGSDVTGESQEVDGE